jgi:cytochrome c nitrite reductase small subunit
MNDQYASWSKSSHHAAARCVDCHLPHELLPKLVAKASNGWHHSKGFTLEDFHEPILIKPPNARILQESCLSCHGDLVHTLVRGATTGEQSVECVHCHKHVGHGPRP